MSWTTMQDVLNATAQLSPVLIDITGGAPELHSQLEQFVAQLVKQNHRVQVRTNLTILLEEKNRNLPQRFKELGVELVASLPCYTEENVRLQRGEGVFEKSIEALQHLNTIGYGTAQMYPLTLVYNPCSAVLPPEQSTLEQDYRKMLGEKYGIQFTRLHTITNMPIGRFLDKLKNQKSEYINLLKQSFNPQTIEGLMCRHQISGGWGETFLGVILM